MLTLTNGMFLYHGSYTEVSSIDLSKCKQGKDFGCGFYLTSSYKQARSFVPLSINKQINEGNLPAGYSIGYILTEPPGLSSFILPVAMVHLVLKKQTKSLS